MTEAIDIIAKHGLNPRSYTGSVLLIMEMGTLSARKLLIDLLDFPVDYPGSSIVTQLAAAYLVQTELKFRQANGGESILPFNQGDYQDALDYAMEHAPEHERVYIGTNRRCEADEDNTSSTGESKRGRKGSVFPIVKAFYEENKELSANEAAKRLAAEHGLKENSARVYWYKCKKEDE